MEFRHKPHLSQTNKSHKKNRTKSGGKIEVIHIFTKQIIQLDQGKKFNGSFKFPSNREIATL